MKLAKVLHVAEQKQLLIHEARLDINFSGVMTKFLGMDMLVERNALTAQFEFNSMDTLLNKFELRWNNVTGLGSGNTNSNIDASNSIKQRVIEKNENIFSSGYSYHILHNAASKANSKISKLGKFDLENYSVDLYYWFDISSKQNDALLEYYEFCDQEYEEVIRYISIRWLYIEQCINRELKKFHPKESNHTFYLKLYLMQHFVTLKKLYQIQ